MKCVKCGAELDPGERFCGECGQPVQVSAAPSTPAGQVAVGTCPKCSANVEAGKRFCSSCGYDLMAPAQKPQAAVTYPAVAPSQPVTVRTSSSSPRSGLIIGVVALVAILLLGSVGIGLWIWFGARATTTASIAGTWNCVITAPVTLAQGGPPPFRMTLAQSGSTITGTVLHEEGQEQIAGTFDGQKFSFRVSDHGVDVEVQLALSPDGSTMKGELREHGTSPVVCTR